MTQSADANILEQPVIQGPFPRSLGIEISPAHAGELLKSAQSLPRYDNKEFYSPDLQKFVHECVRASCPDEFDALINLIKEQIAQWPYWVLLRGIHFDDGNRLFVAVNRAFGELVAPPYEKPRAQLVHYIQPSTDIRSSRGGRESERLHTDTADWKAPVEFISMACVQPDRDGGGRTRILDVETVRDEVRNRLGDETLKLLQNEPVPWQLAAYCGGGVEWRPVLTKSSICWRRYTIDLALDAEGASLSNEMRSSLDAFEEVITATTRTAEFLMREGELLFSDNTRTIHSRTPVVDDASGQSSDRLMLRAWIRAS